jgi:hypothetical protein
MGKPYMGDFLQKKFLEFAIPPQSNQQDDTQGNRRS